MENLLKTSLVMPEDNDALQVRLTERVGGAPGPAVRSTYTRANSRADLETLTAAPTLRLAHHEGMQKEQLIMGIQTPERTASNRTPIQRTGSASPLKNESPARPYTSFSRGGQYRFRSQEPTFRPFRIG